MGEGNNHDPPWAWVLRCVLFSHFPRAVLPSSRPWPLATRFGDDKGCKQVLEERKWEGVKGVTRQSPWGLTLIARSPCLGNASYVNAFNH